MPTIIIDSLDHQGARLFCGLTDTQLRTGSGTDFPPVFIAESPKVIDIALRQGYEPVAMMCEERHIEGDAAGILAKCPPEMPVYTGARETLASITGYRLTRGVLCAFRRRRLPSPEDICRDARRVCVIDGVCDTTNIGAVFRSAAALGIDGILLTSGSCDPLNRRSVRVSMGNIFLIPWTWIGPDALEVARYGMKSVALALREDSVSIDSPLLQQVPKLALILGTEGDGLSGSVIAGADFVCRIPMHRGVDSLNVAAASAVAFYALCR